MKQLLTILKKDLRSYFDQPTGYILNIIFIVAIVFMFFRTIDTTNEASLRPMFSLLPWILAIYIPAVSMRLFSEEQRDGTLEILFTQPVRGTTVILAKFLAGLIFITIGILGTILIPISLAFAGNLDVGALVAQYIGAILLSSSLVSIGIFASSLTKNQIVAFIISLSVSMILLVLGLDFINITLPSSLSILLQDLSPLTHFSSITRGLIDLRDVLYFISIDIAFLSITYLNTKGKSLNSNSPQYRNLRIGVGSLVVLSLVFAWFGSSIQGRIDLTEDKIYSLAPSTKQIFNDLDDYLTITLYESKDHPINTALTARDVNDFLSDLDARSKYIKIKHRYPDSDEKDKEESEIAGIPPVQFNVQRQGEFQVKTGYLGMTLAYANNKEVIPFIESLDGLEYKLASLTFKMLNDAKKSITFIDLPSSKTNQSMGSFISLLAQQYEISVIDMNDINNIKTPPDVFIIAGGNYENVDMNLILPNNKIQDLILQGVSFFVLADTVNIDSNRMVAYPNQNSGSMLWENFGIIIKNNMLYDLVSYETLPFGTQSGEVLLPYPYWIRIPPNDSKVTGKVNSTLFPWASSIELIQPLINNIKTDPIIITAPTTSIQYDYQDLSPDAKFNPSNNTGSQILGVKIENNEISNTTIRSIIISDSDWLTDNIAGRNQSNYALGMNMIDWLAQENQLADIRSKVIRERKLDWSSKGSFFSHQSLTKNLNLISSPILLIIYGLTRYTKRKTIQRKVFKNEE
tara:strand:- start:16470 stop:18704 length:2235 start_codon:yes stop_codon:yes gene_type:complete